VVTRNGWFAARPSGTEIISKIYAESFTSQGHLDAIVTEAQPVVAVALGSGAAWTRAALTLPHRETSRYVVNLLDSLKRCTTVVADTGDVNSILADTCRLERFLLEAVERRLTV
jgi:hypothetical protein